MKRIALILLFASVILCSCGNKTSINYDGSNTVNIVLREELNLNATSKEALSYRSDNKLVVEVSPEGIIYGKNVGEANVTIYNSENEITVHVIVDLFEEPTFNFGVSSQTIKSIYGEPNYNFHDSVYIYGDGNNWYSWAVWRMDFFFDKDKYYEADLYIRNDLDVRINDFLNDNYFYFSTVTDTITSNDAIEIDLFLNEPAPENATMVVGRQSNAGQYNDIRLMYAPFSYDDK